MFDNIEIYTQQTTLSIRRGMDRKHAYICIYVYISLCIWIALLFLSLWQEGRGEFKGINNIISLRLAAPVLRDHYNFITSSHSNIDDDGDGDDVSDEFSCVILEVAWDALTSSKQFNWETARCDTLGRRLPVSLPCCTYERFDGFVDDCTRFSKSSSRSDLW